MLLLALLPACAGKRGVDGAPPDGEVTTPISGAGFRGFWGAKADRIWVGPEYWANRLQDWRVRDGRLECVAAAADRNVQVLTRQLGPERGEFSISTKLGWAENAAAQPNEGWIGVRLGAKDELGDYRRGAIYGKGLDCGMTAQGRLFIGDPQAAATDGAAAPLDGVLLELSATPSADGYRLALKAVDEKTGDAPQIVYAEISRDDISTDVLTGNVALVCQRSARKRPADAPDLVQAWFSRLDISGEKVEVRDEQAFGPILFAQHTLSRGVLKLTAQLVPVGEKDSKTVRLEIRRDDGKWKEIAKAPLDPLARTARFRVEKWDDSRDVSYRVAYALADHSGELRERYWGGTIRKNPVDKEALVVAGFTGNNDLGFPNNDIVENVKAHDPDLLVFTGDQIYERVAGYGVQRSPLDKATLDYLRKWWLVGWSFGDLMRDRPTICLPDDHDVYHGNVWGAGGKQAIGEGKEGQDSGGYKMPAEWVKMVERTQTSHHPDAYDPTPILQGIGVYYGALNYGGVSFAILEDRKWKSSPTTALPAAKVVNGWAQNLEFDAAKEGDVPGAVLLGERQLKFLGDWAGDWSAGAQLKVVVSQTIFANVATLPPPANDDDVVPGLRLMQPGEYVEGDVPVADMDSNGWPRTGRNRALREMRKGFAFHLAGDQHLGSMIQYGVDEWGDAPFAFCVPAIANIWPRRWYPSEAGQGRLPGYPKYTGKHLDGFGNKMTVWAVSNPVVTGKQPSMLYDRATGYGIVRLNKSAREITVECWPRFADPRDPGTGGQYPGWPIKIAQWTNYGRGATGYLPELQVKGLTDPVVKVFDEASGELVYALRIKGDTYRPKAFTRGPHTVEIGDPDLGKKKTLKGLLPAAAGESIAVEF